MRLYERYNALPISIVTSVPVESGTRWFGSAAGNLTLGFAVFGPFVMGLLFLGLAVLLTNVQLLKLQLHDNQELDRNFKDY